MTVDVSSLDGNFKERYADKIEHLVPEHNKLGKKIKFKKRKRLGGFYNQPVRVRRAMGTTYAGETTSGTAFTLNAAKSGLMKNARTQGTSFVLRESIADKTVLASQASKAAFADTYDEVVMDMLRSAKFHEELLLLYGQSATGIGAIESHTESAATVAEVVITAATWSPGIWAQFEGGYVDIINDPNGSPTLRNTNAVLEVTAVDPDTRTVSLTGNATDIDAIANGEAIVPRGAHDVSGAEYNWFAGLDRILTNTGSLFGIDAATYNVWKSNTKAAGGGLTMAILMSAAAKTVVRSGAGPLTCYVSTYTWTDLNQDFTSLRRYASSTKGSIELGTSGADDDAIVYYGPNGRVSICPHPMVKGGEAFLVNEGDFIRVGASELTFERPASVKGSQAAYFQQLTDAAGFELRCMWDQALMCKRPAGQAKITGIVNTAG